METLTRDPYRYFRVEAAELLDNLTRGVLGLESGACEEGAVAGILRFAHTLKGAAHVVRQTSIGDAAHSVEDILLPFRGGGAPVPRENTGQILQLLGQIGASLALLSPSSFAGGHPAFAVGDPLDTLRVEVGEVEGILTSLSEAHIELAAVDSEAAAVADCRQLAQLILRHAAGSGGLVRVQSFTQELIRKLGMLERGLVSAAGRTARELARAQEGASRLRLLPAETMFPALIRAARDAAETLGKQVVIETAGGGIRLEAQMLAVLRDALLQLVRNAAAHGIEKPSARAGAGKPPAGRIELRVGRSSGDVTLLCRDDGAGFDLAAIRRAVIDKGAIPAAEGERLGLQEAIDLILKGGVSTAPVVTALSGRGIGLDLVRDAVTRLKGEIAVETGAGTGATVRIRVPVSLASLPVLLVEVGGEVAALPLESVRETLGVREPDIVTSEGGPSIVWRDRAIRFLSLADALLSKAAPAPGHPCHVAVVLASGQDIAAVGVGRLQGTGTVLVRSLPPAIAAARIIAGVSQDSKGEPILVLDPAALVAAVRAGQNHAPAAPARRAPILVIDDSLTTRMVEQNLLEAAGYQVEVATSGEDAMEKARACHYSLFLVDVEMPGMDGFEFIRRSHDDPLLRDIPSILVTTRNSDADHRRGEEVGARAFFVKNEFDQASFLETIRRLTG